MAFSITSGADICVNVGAEINEVVPFVDTSATPAFLLVNNALRSSIMRSLLPSFGNSAACLANANSA